MPCSCAAARFRVSGARGLMILSIMPSPTSCLLGARACSSVCCSGLGLLLRYFGPYWALVPQHHRLEVGLIPQPAPRHPLYHPGGWFLFNGRPQEGCSSLAGQLGHDPRSRWPPAGSGTGAPTWADSASGGTDGLTLSLIGVTVGTGALLILGGEGPPRPSCPCALFHDPRLRPWPPWPLLLFHHLHRRHLRAHLSADRHGHGTYWVGMLLAPMAIGVLAAWIGLGYRS